MYCLLLPLAPALIPIQSLVLLPCVIMCSRQPHTLFQIPSLLSSDNKCLQAIRSSLNVGDDEEEEDDEDDRDDVDDDDDNVD